MTDKRKIVKDHRGVVAIHPDTEKEKQEKVEGKAQVRSVGKNIVASIERGPEEGDSGAYEPVSMQHEISDSGSISIKPQVSADLVAAKIDSLQHWQHKVKFIRERVDNVKVLEVLSEQYSGKVKRTIQEKLRKLRDEA